MLNAVLAEEILKMAAMVEVTQDPVALSVLVFIVAVLHYKRHR